MTTIQPNVPINTQTTIQPKNEVKPKEKSSFGTGAKIALGASLTALAAAGIYIATKGKGGKNVKNLGNQIESLTQSCNNVSKRFGFETPQIGERLEEISQLPKKEKVGALKQLKKTLDHAEVVKWHIEGQSGLPKGMKTLPDDVRQAYEAKDVLKTGEIITQEIYRVKYLS